jgi:hypothetical protein
MTRRSLLSCLVALALSCGACSVDATVTVKVREDGSGFVRADVVADAEAVQTAEVGGGRLEERVRLSDLPAAGWTVGPWTRRRDGSARLTLKKPFGRLDEVPGILAELNGPYGPLRDPAFERTRSFFETEFSADAVVDLGAMTTGITEDAELVARLQAQGVDVNVVDQQLLAQLRDAFTVHLVVDLPGPGKTTVTPEAGRAAHLSASSTVRDGNRITLVVVATGLAALAVVVAAWPRRRGRGRRARRRRGQGNGPRRPVVSSGGGVPPTRRGTPPAT